MPRLFGPPRRLSGTMTGRHLAVTLYGTCVYLDSVAILLDCVQSYTPAKIRRRFDTG
jgi:hypothetical protein